MNPKNPFIVTGYLLPEYFCDRIEETAFLINKINNNFNTALFSIRKMGKTGLIHNVIHHQKKSNINSIYFDIMMTDSLSDFIYTFSKAIFNQSTSLNKRIIKKILSIFSAFSPSINIDKLTGSMSLELKLNKVEEIYHDLDNLLSFIASSDKQYMIAIDEFQQILNYPETNIESYLRSKIQFMNNTSFVFSGSKKNMLLSIFGDYSKPLWQTCNFLELKPIEKDKYFEFIIHHFSNYNRIIDESVLEYIYNKSRGTTYYIQLFCNYLFNTQIKHITLANAQDTLNYIIKDRDDYFINYYYLLTNKQKGLLYALAKENGFAQPMSKDFISDYLLGAASTIKSSLETLINKEIIYYNDEKYYVADVLFAEWLCKLDKF